MTFRIIEDNELDEIEIQFYENGQLKSVIRCHNCASCAVRGVLNYLGNTEEIIRKE